MLDDQAFAIQTQTKIDFGSYYQSSGEDMMICVCMIYCGVYTGENIVRFDSCILTVTKLNQSIILMVVKIYLLSQEYKKGHHCLTLLDSVEAGQES